MAGRLPQVEDEAGQAPEQPSLELAIPESVRPGVWANWASVSHSPFEFTIDFARLEFMGKEFPETGIIVSRISLSPLFVTQLIDALQSNWDKYAAKALPREVNQGADDHNQADSGGEAEHGTGS